MPERTAFETLLLATGLAVIAISAGALFCVVVSRVIKYFFGRKNKRLESRHSE